jgi:hypothetical protein
VIATLKPIRPDELVLVRAGAVCCVALTWLVATVALIVASVALARVNELTPATVAATHVSAAAAASSRCADVLAPCREACVGVGRCAPECGRANASIVAWRTYACVRNDDDDDDDDDGDDE